MEATDAPASSAPLRVALGAGAGGAAGARSSTSSGAVVAAGLAPSLVAMLGDHATGRQARSPPRARAHEPDGGEQDERGADRGGVLRHRWGNEGRGDDDEEPGHDRGESDRSAPGSAQGERS